MTLKKSLAAFKGILNTHTPVASSVKTPAIYCCNGSDYDLTDKKSSFFYQNLINQKIELPYQENFWRSVLGNLNEINFEKVYTTKIKLCPDSKVAQFNYKLLHLILPCLTNLHKWRIVDDFLCPLCHVRHDVIHLLYGCIKAQTMWNSVNSKLNMNISLFDITCGCVDDLALNFLISLVCFCIYKEWLQLYRQTKEWENNNIVVFVKRNIWSYFDTYKKCNTISNSKLEFIERFLS